MCNQRCESAADGVGLRNGAQGTLRQECDCTEEKEVEIKGVTGRTDVIYFHLLFTVCFCACDKSKPAIYSTAHTHTLYVND